MAVAEPPDIKGSINKGTRNTHHSVPRGIQPFGLERGVIKNTEVVLHLVVIALIRLISDREHKRSGIQLSSIATSYLVVVAGRFFLYQLWLKRNIQEEGDGLVIEFI